LGNILGDFFPQKHLVTLPKNLLQECGKQCFMAINFIPHTFQHRLGSILQNTVSAENFSDKISS
jgi:hypothetical protein